MTNTPNEKENELHVFFDGPFSDGGSNSDNGDEHPFWIICVSSDLDAQPKYAYRVWNYEKAASLADKIAKDQDLTIISSATSAR